MRIWATVNFNGTDFIDVVSTESGQMYYQIKSDSTFITSCSKSAAMPNGDSGWWHIGMVLTNDGTDTYGSYYTNGYLMAEDSRSGAASALSGFNVTSVLHFATYIKDGMTPYHGDPAIYHDQWSLNGKFDDLRIWTNYGASAENILDIYNSGGGDEGFIGSASVPAEDAYITTSNLTFSTTSDSSFLWAYLEGSDTTVITNTVFMISNDGGSTWDSLDMETEGLVYGDTYTNAAFFAQTNHVAANTNAMLWYNTINPLADTVLEDWVFGRQ
jgi:hypothetical protein